MIQEYLRTLLIVLNSKENTIRRLSFDLQKINLCIVTRYPQVYCLTGELQFTILINMSKQKLITTIHTELEKIKRPQHVNQ